MRNEINLSHDTRHTTRITLCLLLTAYCLLSTGTAFAQATQKVTEADFTGAWLFEKAEYREYTGTPSALVLREKITSPDLLWQLLPLCLGNGIKTVLFLGDRIDVDMLLGLKQNVECYLQELGSKQSRLEISWRDENTLEDSPPMIFYYEISREGEDLLVLTHEVLCHDRAGLIHQNVLKMFLKMIR